MKIIIRSSILHFDGSLFQIKPLGWETPESIFVISEKTGNKFEFSVVSETPGIYTGYVIVPVEAARMGSVRVDNVMILYDRPNHPEYIKRLSMANWAWEPWSLVGFES